MDIETAQLEKKSFLDIVKTGLTKEQLEKDIGPLVSAEFERKQEREIKTQITEALERDNKRKNIVVMGIEEELEGDKLKEYVGKMFAEMLGGEGVEFDDQGRIGKKSGKNRPIRIRLEEDGMKFKLLKKASALKSNSEYKNIYVSPDLTRQQQEEDKKLRDKLKEIRSSGVDGAKISKGQIVRGEGSSREILFGQEN